MYIIGVTGLSCSGKTSLSKQLEESLTSQKCLLISMDDFYKELSQDEYARLHDDSAEINFDTPASIDFNLLTRVLGELKNADKTNKTPVRIRLPKFDLATCVVTSWREIMSDQYEYVVVEGLFVFSDPQVASMCNLKIWVETSDYICALRRFIKFTKLIKGYTPEYVYNQCVKYVIPGQEMYIKPVKKCCDFFVNGEKDTSQYISMIVKYIDTTTIITT